MTVACVLVAAGSGERLGAGRPKALVDLAGRPLVWYAARAVLDSGVLDHLIVVVPGGFESEVRALLSPLAAAARARRLDTVAGGPTRQQSVAAGLACLPALSPADVVLVHDAARCLAPPSLVARISEAAAAAIAVVPGVPVVDTLVEVGGDGLVVAGTDRARLRVVQTPQGFGGDVLVRAHAAARDRGDLAATDDAGLVARLGLPVTVIPGDEAAFKITTPLDLLRAEALLGAGAAGRRTP